LPGEARDVDADLAHPAVTAHKRRRNTRFHMPATIPEPDS
jgi:hypothetical protein